MENIREIALDTLLALEREEDYSHRLIKAVLDKYDYLDGRDKAFFKRLTEGTLERQIELDYDLDHFSKLPVKKLRPLIRSLMRLSVYQLLYMDSIPDSAVCNEACKLAAKRGFQNLKGYVNGVLREISRQKGCLPLPDEEKEPVKYLSVKYSMPEWLVELWLDEYGREITLTLLRKLMEIHPVSLRFSLKLPEAEREALCGKMKALGAGLIESPYLPYVYLLQQPGDVEGVTALPGFEEGLCTVQDVSSALAVAAAGIRAGDFVIDVCAAPGGKSIFAAELAAVSEGQATGGKEHIGAESMGGSEGQKVGGRKLSGRILARDLSEEKIALIRENICRMAAKGVEVQVFDGTRTDDALAGKADVVFLDVPCSGLGVMGKKRDIKYRITREGLESLTALQKQIVRASSGYVKPGGTLIYSTCTIHGGENQAMVRFITRELGFEPVSLEGALPEVLLEQKACLEAELDRAGKAPGGSLTEAEKAACIQLLPGYMESDGFFIAKFRNGTVRTDAILE